MKTVAVALPYPGRVDEMCISICHVESGVSRQLGENDCQYTAILAS
jgi:hypothetical protein